VASARVAEKIGMKYERDVDFRDFGQVALYAQAERDFVERERRQLGR
jgi:RimJ/RimL family protein N-acetyltransferase